MKCLALTPLVMAASFAAQAGVYEDRERDWRNGAIVYQVRPGPAFERHTDKALDACLIVANPGDTAVRETLLVGMRA